MGKHDNDPGHEAVMGMISEIIERPRRHVKGYIVVAVMDDDAHAVATNSCCIHHACGELMHLAEVGMMRMPACSDER